MGDNIICRIYCVASVQVAETKLAKFLEEVVVPPNMIDTIVDGEVVSSRWLSLSTTHS